eukprot:TRINITY_DN7208_c0_g1_i4.p1 TRINITY_DN7208_c0_g1~~TRINITY_DN7208_c0_g1_i4.p1  ORF type:complete len:200 (+),score=58.23 TRINITY_DN7208_c0_g1_i4:47-646(+)
MNLQSSVEEKTAFYEQIKGNEEELELLFKVLAPSPSEFCKIRKMINKAFMNDKARKLFGDRVKCLRSTIGMSEEERGEEEEEEGRPDLIWKIEGLKNKMEVCYETENDDGRYICYHTLTLGELTTDASEDEFCRFEMDESINTKLCRVLCIPFVQSKVFTELVPECSVDSDCCEEFAKSWGMEQVKKVISSMADILSEF